MKYVFFDIECACVYKNVAKICVFGYCVADEEFNILEKEDILINPNGKFHLTDHGGGGIVLPYDYDSFAKLPDFKKFYPRIKEILEGEDKLVFGHAAMNDVKYLNLETRRYKLPSFRFQFADTQVLYMAMTETFDRQTGLEALTKIFEIDYTPHCAADDAYATMCVAREMCAHESCTVPELLKKYGVRLGKIMNGQYSPRIAAAQRLHCRKTPPETRTRRTAFQIQRFRIRVPRAAAEQRAEGEAVQLFALYRRGSARSRKGS